MKKNLKAFTAEQQLNLLEVIQTIVELGNGKVDR